MRKATARHAAGRKSITHVEESFVWSYSGEFLRGDHAIRKYLYVEPTMRNLVHRLKVCPSVIVEDAR